MNRAARCSYEVLDAVWRELGDEVLVLAPPPSTRVLVLGGGSAVVWRHVERTTSPERLAAAIGGGITVDEVTEALELLVSAGLARRQDRP